MPRILPLADEQEIIITVRNLGGSNRKSAVGQQNEGTLQSIHPTTADRNYGEHPSAGHSDCDVATAAEIADLEPRDRIDVQSFIWAAGRYKEKDDDARPTNNGMIKTV